MVLPLLLIIGCMKCATTTLFAELNRIDGISGGHCFSGVRCDMGNGKKEKHFFDWNDARHWQRGCAAYSSLYNPRGGAPIQIGIDASPSYLRTPQAAERVLTCYDHVALTRTTFVAVLRDPVSRLHSEFSMLNRTLFARWRRRRPPRDPGASLAATDGGGGDGDEEDASFASFVAFQLGGGALAAADDHRGGGDSPTFGCPRSRATATTRRGRTATRRWADRWSARRAARA